MTRRHRVSFIKAILFLAIVASLILPAGVTTKVVKAAEKPSIVSEMTIGTGTTHSDYFGYGKNDKYTIEVNNPAKKATYSFTSSNKNVVTLQGMYKADDGNTQVLYLKGATATISSFTEPPRVIKF